MKNVNSLLNIVVTLVAVIAASIFTYGFLKSKDLNKTKAIQESSTEVNEYSSYKSETDEAANRYLKELQLKMKAQQLEAYKSLKIKKDINQIQPHLKDDDFSQVPKEQQITKETTTYQRQVTADSFQVPTEINASNAADFIQAARQSGYEVQLNEKYEVISIRPIGSSGPSPRRLNYDSQEANGFE